MKTARRIWTAGICLAGGVLLLAGAIAPADEQPGKDEEALWAALLKGKALTAQGRNAEAIQQYEQAVALATRVFGADHVNTATLLNILAELYREQGQYGKAEPLYLRSLGIREAKLGKDHLGVAESLNNLALMYQTLGRYAKAEPLFLRSLQIWEAKLGKDHAEVAHSLHNLAVLYRNQGDYAKAEPLFLRSLQIEEAKLGKEHPYVATSLHNLATLYKDQGEYAKAEPLFLRSLQIKETKLGKEHPYVANSLLNLAALYQDQGQYAKAERFYLRSLEIYEAKLGREHPNVASGLHNLAGLYQDQGQYAKAELLLLRSLQIKEAKLGKEHPNVASSLDKLASLYKEQGQYAKAEPLYLRSLQIEEAKLGKEHPYVARGLNNLAGLYEAQGRYAKAESLYLRSLEISEAKLSKDHPDVANSLINLAMLHASQRHWEKAAGTIERARRAARAHLARTLFGLSEREMLIFLQANDQHKCHMSLSLGLEKRSDPKLAARSAGWLLNGKAVAQEVLAERARLIRASTDPRLKKTASQLLDARQHLAALTRQLPPPGQEADYRQGLENLAAEEVQLFKDLGRLAGEAVPDTLWVELKTVRRALPANTVLIDIARFDVWNFQAKPRERHWQPAHYAAWIIPPLAKGDVQLIDLGEGESIDQAIQQFRRSMAGAGKAIYQEGEADAEALLRKDLEGIARRILTPLLPAAGKYERWLVSPDASLWLVPWAALPMADGRYLVEKHRLSYLVTGRDVVRVPAKVEPGPALILADPDFDLDPDKAADQLPRLLPKEKAPAVIAYAADARVGSAWPPLFGTAKEVAAITSPLKDYLQAEPTVHVRGEALEAVCKASLRPRVLVLCTHAYFLPDPVHRPDEHLASRSWDQPLPGIPLQNPLDRCGLILAGANQRAKIKEEAIDDGVLTGREVVQLDLRGTELVVLSACDTGVGDVRNGEGVAGLRQAFQLAGAQAVVASLWKVPDAQTAHLMARFWQELAKDPDRAEALRKAQLAMIQERRQGKEKAAHPYFWAAFTLTGLTDPSRPGAAPAKGPGAAAPGQPAPAAHAAPASIQVRLRDPQAQVWFSGQLTTKTGRLRTFESPDLQPGKIYTYVLRVRWTEAGRARTEERKVEVSAGANVIIDLTAPAPRPAPEGK